MKISVLPIAFRSILMPVVIFYCCCCLAGADVSTDSSAPSPKPTVAEKAERTAPEKPPAVSPKSVKAHVDHLVTFLHKENKTEKGVELSLVVEASFAFAQSRSAKLGVVSENASALLALGIVVGHPKSGWVAGFRPEENRLAEIEQQGAKVRLGGRRDLARHFCLSAALSVMAGERLSRLIGRAKEQSDAVGGSGFSFADLLADEAGTRLGRLAVQKESSARRIQRTLAKKHSSKLYMPAIEGLPEGIPADRLEKDYGGIGGKGYRRLEQEIQNRLDQCQLFARPAGQSPPVSKPLERTPRRQ